MTEKRFLRQLFAIALALALLATGLPLSGSLAVAQDEQLIDLPPIEKPVKGNPKLGSVLDQLAAALEAGGLDGAAALAKQRSMDIVDGRVRVIIEASPGKADAARSAAAALGANVETGYGNMVRALVPVSSLTGLASDPAIRLVRSPLIAIPSVPSEGVSLIDADDWHSAGFTGSGVKVGILDLGFSGYGGLLGTELPLTVTTWWAP
ncbi:MAG: hypothetical protein V3S51_07620, partial [Dehalococcoidia bacterium]